MSDFPSRLQLVANAYGSARSLAKAIDVSEGTLRRWINGETEPSREKLVALADIANVSLEWLATGKGVLDKAPPMQEPYRASNGGLLFYVFEKLKAVGVTADQLADYYQSSELMRVFNEQQLEKLGEDSVFTEVECLGRIMDNISSKRGETRFISMHPCLEDLKIMKDEVQDQIMRHISFFSQKTGLQVEGLELEIETDVEGKKQPVGVKMKVVL